jgi:hypothetical protein
MSTNTPITSKSFSFSMPRLLISVESLAIFVAACVFYAQQQFNGWIFLLLLLTPDLSMVGYLANKSAGAMLYNIVHTYTLPLILIGLSLAFTWGLGLQLGLIWLAHNSMDRTVGYGLKYQSGFKDTHLSRI